MKTAHLIELIKILKTLESCKEIRSSAAMECMVADALEILEEYKQQATAPTVTQEQIEAWANEAVSKHGYHPNYDSGLMAGVRFGVEKVISLGAAQQQDKKLNVEWLKNTFNEASQKTNAEIMEWFYSEVDLVGRGEQSTSQFMLKAIPMIETINKIQSKGKSDAIEQPKEEIWDQFASDLRINVKGLLYTQLKYAKENYNPPTKR